MSTDPRSNQGMTLIELIMFILIISVGLVGILSVLNVAVFHSADPMVRKQMLSIAEALLEEAEAQPFTYCDPELDAGWDTAASVAACTTPEVLGPEGSQTRTSSTHPFNNVSDYDGLSLSPITDISGNNPAPAGYTATVTITREALGGIGSGTTLDMVRIAVTISRGSDSLTLEGYRARYWPNDLPW